MGGRVVEMPKVDLVIRVAPADAGPRGRFAAPLASTALLTLGQASGGKGPATGGNALALELPATLGPGVTASPAPLRPASATIAYLEDGADARPWPGAEATWVVEITDWEVAVPAEPPAAEGPCGTASGRLAVFVRDTFGAGFAAQLAGTFTGLEVRCAPAGP
jgi:hypothetical protein